MNEPIITFVRRRLDETRGTWVAIAQDSGVPYHTLTKIAQGKTEPRIGTVQLLLDYFKRVPDPGVIAPTHSIAGAHPVTLPVVTAPPGPIAASAPAVTGDCRAGERASHAGERQRQDKAALPWPACGERRKAPPEVPGSGVSTRRRNPDLRSAEKAL
jgi:hypothetical protein